MICHFISLLFLFIASNAFAIRPFVTDDGRIVDKGQFTSEIWGEINEEEGHSQISEHFLATVSFTEWLEITAIGHLYVDSNKNAKFASPSAQAKFLFVHATENGSPGIAASFGHNFKYGSGPSAFDASSSYALGMATWRLFQDHLLVHFNGGATSTHQEHVNKTRPFLGIGVDRALWDYHWRLAAEAYTGDPYNPYRSNFALQAGLRHLINDYINIDTILGTQEIYDDHFQNSNKREYWMQIGVRLTGDFFRPDHGNPHGAKGMFH